jgi:hypothetical protein
MTGDELTNCMLAAMELTDELQFPSMLMGALALGFYGEGRATRDVDLMIAANHESAMEQIRTRAAERGFTVDESWLERYPDVRTWQVRLLYASVIVDIMRPRDEHDVTACQRRQPEVVAGRRIWVVSREDLIIQKLKAGRPHDFDDVIPFFARHRAELDHAFLNLWAGRVGVREELDYLWSRSE